MSGNGINEILDRFDAYSFSLNKIIVRNYVLWFDQ